jgi:hypothetical protein
MALPPFFKTTEVIMNKTLTLLGCMAAVAMPIAFNAAAFAQNGGAEQPPTANYTGNHAPNNGTGGEAGNPPSSTDYDNDNNRNRNNMNRTSSDYRNYHRTHPNPAYYSPSDTGGGSDNSNPALNSGNKGGGEAR